MYSDDFSNNVQSKNKKYQKNEIIPQPLNFEDKTQVETIYDSKDLVQNVISVDAPYVTYFYVADEAKYLK